MDHSPSPVASQEMTIDSKGGRNTSFGHYPKNASVETHIQEINIPGSHPSISGRRKPYINPQAQHWISNTVSTSDILEFHQVCPWYSPTALISLPDIAKEIGVREVFVKDESQRCGLPSFKILGATWAVCQVIAARANVPVNSGHEVLAEATKVAKITLVAATDGNHGRAVARIGSIMEIKCHIFVPRDLDEGTIELIRNEGAEVILTEDDYDGTVMLAKAFAESVTGGVLLQDTAFEGYEEIPQVRLFK
jgi:diaminopropionate ammonia-lyase family